MALALAQQGTSDLIAAEASCRKALHLTPKNVSALVPLAGCLSARGDHRVCMAAQARALDRTAVLALAYLLLPNLIFLLGWFHPGLAVPLCLLGGWLFVTLARQSTGVTEDATFWPAALVILGVAAAWSALGGAGHFVFANHDWVVRDAVLGDLIAADWPPAYDLQDGETWLLRSAIGYYLPAALMAKLLGVGAADVLLYLWTVLGTGLFLLLTPIARRSWPTFLGLLLVVVCFSGMDAVGYALGTKGNLARFFPNSIDWWVPYSFPALTAQLFWAPNHALPMWIVTALIFRHWGNAGFWRLLAFVVPLTFIWTPFASAGVLPFLLLALLRRNGWKDLRDLGLLWWLFALALAYPSLRFITLDIGRLPVHVFDSSATEFHNLGGLRMPGLRDYLIFIAMEFGILALALLPLLRHSFGLYGVAVAMLLALPVVSLGPSMDTMRMLCISPLLMLLFITLDTLQDKTRWSARPLAIGVLGLTLLAGAPSALFEMARALIWVRTPPDYSQSLLDKQGGQLPPHYGARLTAADLRLLLNTPGRVPAANQRPPPPPAAASGRSAR